MKGIIRKNILFIVLSIIFTALGCFWNDSGDGETGSPNSPTGDSTLVVNATYNGTVKDTGTGKIYVYVFSELTTAREQWVYQAITDSEAEVGTEYKLTISNIAAGSYYVLVLYDYKLHNKAVPGNTDRYVLYDDAAYADEAETAEVIEGETTTLDNITFGDSYQLGSEGAYMAPIPKGTIEITTTYTGATGTGNIYAYVFSSLGTKAQSPLYQGNTSTLTSGVITIPNIPVGDYYVVLFYDLADNGADIAGENDPYVIYDSVQYREDGSQVSITDGATTQITQDFADTDLLGAGGDYKVNPHTGSVTVNATYTGTIKADVAGTSDGDGMIYVYLYTALTDAQATPLYSASTGAAVSQGTQYQISVTDVVPGSYYMLVFYDFKLHNSTPGKPGNTDRYVLYNGAQYANSATTIAVTDGNTTTPGDVSFGDTYQMGPSGSYGGVVEVKATYSGTERAGVAGVSNGTGKIFVYIYSSLTDAQTDPLYSFSTPAEAASGTQYTITVTSVPAGNYYVLIFYDYKDHNPDTAGDTDRYLLYNNTGSQTAATTATVTNTAKTSITQSFGDANQLGSGGTYNP